MNVDRRFTTDSKCKSHWMGKSSKHKHTTNSCKRTQSGAKHFFFPSHNFEKRIISKENWNGTDNDSNASHYIYIHFLNARQRANEFVILYGFRLPNGRGGGDGVAAAVAATFTTCFMLLPLEVEDYCCDNNSKVCHNENNCFEEIWMFS